MHVAVYIFGLSPFGLLNLWLIDAQLEMIC